MKDRILTLALAAGAFAAFYVLIAPKPAPPAERPTRPVSTEVGPNGYAAIERWLAAEGVETLSLRERYERIADLPGLHALTGNLLITTAPHRYAMRDAELASLNEWIEQGNTLLVLAGLSDTPDWSAGESADALFLQHMYGLTGLAFIDAQAAEARGEDAQDESANEEEDQPDEEAARAATVKLPEPLRFEMTPNGRHPLLDRVDAVVALSEYPSSLWRADASPERLLLELARERESGAPTLWLLRRGEGRLIVSAFGSIFTNKLLGEADNAQLLANIVAWSRGAGGRVIFDDAHQGLVAFYDADAFFGDTRLHTTLWWLFALWLVFVLGPQHLRTNRKREAALDVTSFVRASGGFMARVLKPGAAAQRLFMNFFNDIRRRSDLPETGAPTWEWIGAHTAVPVADLAELRRLHERVQQRRRFDLLKLQRLLAQTRKNLT